jgi:predicted GNAT family acetyltransferase
MAVQVTDAPERQRYEARVEGELVGYTEYRRQDEAIMFARTFVEPAADESEAEEALARYCLDSARRAGDQVEPADPFLAGWIERHPEYADLVHERAAHLGEED